MVLQAGQTIAQSRSLEFFAQQVLLVGARNGVKDQTHPAAPRFEPAGRHAIHRQAGFADKNDRVLRHGGKNDRRSSKRSYPRVHRSLTVNKW